MDVTIKDVPSGAEGSVKEMAMVAIERFLRSRDVKVADNITNKFESDVDAIRKKNSLTAKFEKSKEVEEPEPPVDEPIIPKEVE